MEERLELEWNDDRCLLEGSELTRRLSFLTDEGFGSPKRLSSKSSFSVGPNRLSSSPSSKPPPRSSPKPSSASRASISSSSSPEKPSNNPPLPRPRPNISAQILAVSLRMSLEVHTHTHIHTHIRGVESWFCEGSNDGIRKRWSICRGAEDQRWRRKDREEAEWN